MDDNITSMETAMSKADPVVSERAADRARRVHLFSLLLHAPGIFHVGIIGKRFRSSKAKLRDELVQASYTCMHRSWGPCICVTRPCEKANFH